MARRKIEINKPVEESLSTQTVAPQECNMETNQLSQEAIGALKIDTNKFKEIVEKISETNGDQGVSDINQNGPFYLNKDAAYARATDTDEASKELLKKSAGMMDSIRNNRGTYRDVMEDCMKLQARKSHDYTSLSGRDGFQEGWNALGLQSLWLRLNDKFCRFTNGVLGKEPYEVNDESIEDTLMDMINYCAMGVARIRKDKVHED